MDAVVTVPSEEVSLTVGGVRVRVLRAAALERFVDAPGLLREAPVPEPPYWMHLWPGAMTLARILARGAEIGPGARFVELGCGLALPSLIAARRGALALATDWKREPLNFARRSAALNGLRLQVMQMDWGAPAVGGGVDVCGGAEVAYDPQAEAALIECLRRIVRPGGVVWLADSVNTHRPSAAAALRDAGFRVWVRQAREQEEGRPVWVRVIEGRRSP